MNLKNNYVAAKIPRVAANSIYENFDPSVPLPKVIRVLRKTTSFYY